MALDQQAMEQQAPEEEMITEEEEMDLRIMVNMAEEMIDDGGHEVITQAIEQSNDPGQIIGQFLMQLGSQLAENMPEGVAISPRIMFAVGGWVEQISDYLQEQYDVSKEVMDRAEIFVGTAAQQMQQGQQNAAQPPAAGQPAQQPVMPAGGMQ